MFMMILKKSFIKVILLVFYLTFFGCMSSQKTDDGIVGNWDQYMLTEKDFIYGGTFKVTKNHDSYEMSYIENRDGTTVMSDTYYIEIRNSKGLYDISLKDGIWKFKSDWGNRDIGEFVLYHKSKDLFEGWSYLRGEKRTFNSWRRVM